MQFRNVDVALEAPRRIRPEKVRPYCVEGLFPMRQS
jgi:hypothetical protein